MKWSLSLIASLVISGQIFGGKNPTGEAAATVGAFMPTVGNTGGDGGGDGNLIGGDLFRGYNTAYYYCDAAYGKTITVSYALAAPAWFNNEYELSDSSGRPLCTLFKSAGESILFRIVRNSQSPPNNTCLTPRFLGAQASDISLTFRSTLDERIDPYTGDYVPDFSNAQRFGDAFVREGRAIKALVGQAWSVTVNRSGGYILGLEVGVCP
ncbi:hypothetical protein A3709_05530 [Halioglobus sp. HI00S01]|uniref:hypothetical protein n=1 Tax=Halioglobus sp. HI00S01 TaxID=1822214 RepID=UPI0007C31D8A|nr:hypothetical protein [Halioglobus sp. HI00S01]KZX56559.1 hypothetical protein A3709_05530 [Halioglobus sp. HI00S01]